MDNPSTPKMTARDVCVFYGEKQAIDHVSIDVFRDQVTAFIGPSGCGKSTFLRTMNRMNDTVPGARVTGDIRLDGDDAGIKSASMMVKGPNAYGMLKSEHGVHRLVRISPFDANARRQTSFSSLEVMPELDNNINIEINPADIEMQVYRSSGAGGQHINKTSSAVRLIHKPTGIVTTCQTQRSQLQNREYAMEMMKAKLYQIALQQHKDKIDDIKGVQNEIAWGHQIRSYVFMPYTLVKDNRTGYESSNVQAVMDGDLDGFIFAYLKAASRGELKED